MFLIDFGLTQTYSFEDAQQIKYRKLVGTPNYAAVRTHDGYAVMPRDDMESLLFVLLYLHGGRLPWSHLRKKAQTMKATSVFETIRALKCVSPADLCKGNCVNQPKLAALSQLGLVLTFLTSMYRDTSSGPIFRVTTQLSCE